MTNQELDRVMAKIMGWEYVKPGDIYGPLFKYTNPDGSYGFRNFNPRESISDAFQVLDKMIEDGEILMYALQYDGYTKQWRFVLRKYEEIAVADFWPWADTKELAICLACQRALTGAGEDGKI